MSNTGLNEILVVLGRNSLTFQRDTPQLLRAIDDLDDIKKSLQRLSELPIAKNQAE